MINSLANLTNTTGKNIFELLADEVILAYIRREEGPVIPDHFQTMVSYKIKKMFVDELEWDQKSIEMFFEDNGWKIEDGLNTPEKEMLFRLKFL